MPGAQVCSHTYKVLATAWGIHITIVGAAEFAKDGATSGEPSSLRFSGNASKLDPARKSLLREGLNRARLSRRVLIDIAEVGIVETDFQEDALPVAMCRWVERAFGLEPREVVESFDKGANRYHFVWGIA